VSGRGTKVESALVVIPGYSFWARSTGEAFAVIMPKASWLLSPVTALDIFTGGNPGIITSYLLIKVALPTQKP
jgi:hypothetical protein